MSGSRDTLIDSDGVLKRLRGMGAIDFEHFCADLWRRQGWNAEVRQASADAGVDVALSRKEGGFEQRAVLQAKRYSEDNKVGGPEIQQYGSLREQEGVDFCAVVTTSSFTRGAEDRAEELNVRLVGGEDLVEVIDETDAVDLLDEYAPVKGRQQVGGAEDTGRTQTDRREGPREKVDELRNLLRDPDDWEDRVKEKAWRYVWDPSEYKTKIYGLSLMAGAFVFFFLAELGAAGTGFLAGVGVSVAGGYWITKELHERGTDAVDEYHEPIYEFSIGEIETKAKEKIGATGPNVAAYVMEREENGEELVSKPRKYQIFSVIIDDSSIGVVESAWISMPKVMYNSGQLTQEFFYDQVTRLNHERGELVIYLSDGSEHSWSADNIPDQAMRDIRDRIRAYK